MRIAYKSSIITNGMIIYSSSKFDRELCYPFTRQSQLFHSNSYQCVSSYCSKFRITSNGFHSQTNRCISLFACQESSQRPKTQAAGTRNFNSRCVRSPSRINRKRDVIPPAQNEIIDIMREREREERVVSRESTEGQAFHIHGNCRGWIARRVSVVVYN